MSDVFGLVSLLGTKIHSWVIVDGDYTYPEVFTNLAVAKGVCRALSLLGRQGAIRKKRGKPDYDIALVEARKILYDEIKATIPIAEEGCPDGRMWNGERQIGHWACLRCSHLRYDGVNVFKMKNGLNHEKHEWMCGKVLREAMVARKLADR
jgi:hydroxyacyl-ACP dehydratase HTD2-like protein with hotdog domain